MPSWGVPPDVDVRGLHDSADTAKVTGLVMPKGWASTALKSTSTPGEVLRQQARLHDSLARPGLGMDQFIRGFAHRVRRITGKRYEQQMFYPYFPSEGRQQAAGWCGDVARGLFGAASYQVTAEMVDAVTGVYEKSADQGLFHIEAAMLPAESGFIWLDKPMVITDKWGRKVAERAITWSLATSRVQFGSAKVKDGLGREVDPPVQLMPGIRLSTWSHIEDDRALLREAQAAGQLPKQAGPDGIELEGWDYLWDEFDALAKLGDLSLSHSLMVLFGERHSWNFGKAPHPEDAPGEFRPDNMIAWIYALWTFMGTEIVTMPRPRIDRQTVRFAGRSIKQHEVSVVLLRRSAIKPVESDGPHRDIDWSCRWLVSGHHRHIDSYVSGHHHAVPFKQPGSDHGICAVCWANGERARITWVKPFLKGPEDRPLKATEKLYKLVR